MSAQKQIETYSDVLMDYSAPGTIVWLLATKTRVDIAIGDDKPFAPATLRNRASGSGAQVERAIFTAIPDEVADDIAHVELKLIKDTDGQWHVLASRVEYK